MNFLAHKSQLKKKKKKTYLEDFQDILKLRKEVANYFI